MKIKDIKGYEVIDSRGEPTIEVALKLEDGTLSFSQVPAGKSRGIHEALEKRDNDPKRFFKKGLFNDFCVSYV